MESFFKSVFIKLAFVSVMSRILYTFWQKTVAHTENLIRTIYLFYTSKKSQLKSQELNTNISYSVIESYLVYSSWSAHANTNRSQLSRCIKSIKFLAFCFFLFILFSALFFFTSPLSIIHKHTIYVFFDPLVRSSLFCFVLVIRFGILLQYKCIS